MVVPPFRPAPADGDLVRSCLCEIGRVILLTHEPEITKRNMELLDLIQEGTIGLVRGVEKFDPTGACGSPAAP